MWPLGRIRLLVSEDCLELPSRFRISPWWSRSSHRLFSWQLFSSSAWYFNPTLLGLWTIFLQRKQCCNLHGRCFQDSCSSLAQTEKLPHSFGLYFIFRAYFLAIHVVLNMTTIPSLTAPSPQILDPEPVTACVLMWV